MMKKYEYLEHTADTKFRAYGENREETFTNAALAMMNVMVDTSKVKAISTKHITATGDDMPALLQNFLEQFLILLDSENLFLVEVKKITIKGDRGDYTLSAEVAADDAGKYETIGPQVKAVTYNNMIVEDKMVQVVLDI